MPLILAVDDSASMRQMVAFTLKSAGYQVVEAVDSLVPSLTTFDGAADRSLGFDIQPAWRDLVQNSAGSALRQRAWTRQSRSTAAVIPPPGGVVRVAGVVRRCVG